MILDYYLSIPDDHVMTLMELSQKALVLTLLATGKRPSEVRKMSLDSYIKTNLMYKFVLTSHTKTSSANHPEDRLVIVRRLKKLPEKVCPYKAIQDYITSSYHTRRSPTLFVTTMNGTPISPGTLARWTRDVMAKSGIDTSFFKPYSTGAATSSTAAKCTRSLDLVLKLSNWRTTSSFFKHYLRKVKYFDRPGSSKPRKNNDDFREKSLPNVPAAPVRTYASYSLKRALCRSRNSSVKTPYLDANPDNQGYNKEIKSSEHFLEMDSEPPSPQLSIASSTMTDATDVSDITVADLIPPSVLPISEPDSITPSSLINAAQGGDFKLPSQKSATLRTCTVTKQTVHKDDTPNRNPECTPLPTTCTTPISTTMEIELTADINTGQITITPKPNKQNQPVLQSGKQHGGTEVQQLPLLLPDFDTIGGLKKKQRIFIGYQTEKRITQLKYRSET